MGLATFNASEAAAGGRPEPECGASDVDAVGAGYICPKAV